MLCACAMHVVYVSSSCRLHVFFMSCACALCALYVCQLFTHAGLTYSIHVCRVHMRLPRTRVWSASHTSFTCMYMYTILIHWPLGAHQKPGSTRAFYLMRSSTFRIHEYITYICTYMMKRLRNIFRELWKTGSHLGWNRGLWLKLSVVYHLSYGRWVTASLHNITLYVPSKSC